MKPRSVRKRRAWQAIRPDRRSPRRPPDPAFERHPRNEAAIATSPAPLPREGPQSSPETARRNTCTKATEMHLHRHPLLAQPGERRTPACHERKDSKSRHPKRPNREMLAGAGLRGLSSIAASSRSKARAAKGPTRRCTRRADRASIGHGHLFPESLLSRERADQSRMAAAAAAGIGSGSPAGGREERPQGPRNRSGSMAPAPRPLGNSFWRAGENPASLASRSPSCMLKV